MTLADTTFWCDGPPEKEEAVEEAKDWCMCGLQWARQLGGKVALEPLRRTLAFAGLPFRYHDEQCTLSEYVSFVHAPVPLLASVNQNHFSMSCKNNCHIQQESEKKLCIYGSFGFLETMF